MATPAPRWILPALHTTAIHHTHLYYTLTVILKSNAPSANCCFQCLERVSHSFFWLNVHGPLRQSFLLRSLHCGCSGSTHLNLHP